MTTVHEVQHPGLSEESPARQPSITSEESSARQASFTKLSAEVEMKIKEEAEVELESGKELVADCRRTREDEALTGTEVPRILSPVADFSEIQEDSNSQVESQEEHRDEDEVAEVLPDVRTDHPSSTPEVQYDTWLGVVAIQLMTTLN